MHKQGLSEMAARTIDPPISWLMKLALDRPKLISLAAGFTDNASLPVEASAELLRDLLAEPKIARASLQYGSTAGDLNLRSLTVRRMEHLDGVARGTYNSDNLLITHGSQQFLYLLTECLCDTGDIVLVEDPTYFVYLSILQSHAIEARGVKLDNDGLNLAALERVLDRLKQEGNLHRVKMLYLVSYFQNPSGVTTSAAKKQAMLKLLRRFEKAAGHPIYLLEDAAYRELQFTGAVVPSALQSTGADKRVIFAGTYSKPFATGVRVGFGYLPHALLQTILRVKGNHDFGTSHLLQQLVRAALASGKYETHLPNLKARYARKAAVMAESLGAHFPKAVEWEPATGGLYIWARLPASIQTGPKSKLFRTCLEHDILYVPGELCYADDPTRPVSRNEMRLSFGSASEANIREGIKRIGIQIRKLAPKGTS
jgi:2-aminoadipate transaminase